ncbi:response regulator transcription factor [Reinekea sp.]|jgi:two-component system chemotaxis response regulator CheY|uniref:response regulator transcription factor n=1 Tax=Reinekea sp. TaxID=1970455 RepID=UPI002A801AD5|nr:response regulator [Reinekea sp.]
MDKLKLMVVDDSNVIRNKISRAVTSNRFEWVTSANSGVDALAQFRVHHPDVVTMDLTMPQMDGIDCIQKLIHMNPKLLILVVSALSDKSTGIRALEQGAGGFLLKPFSESDLNHALLELTDFLYV